MSKGITVSTKNVEKQINEPRAHECRDPARDLQADVWKGDEFSEP